ncbi:KilA-N domain-containing protein [Candidatus Saccharibacteria bacterium]|nr:KilA-N domain-containing protein [Candidatus Saccharibacteria bacterium]
MVFKKLRKISVDNSEISVLRVGNEDYISLTDMIRNLEGDDHIRNWMRTRETIEFLGLWEHMYNPDFNPVEFDGFKKQVGLNAFTMSPKKWIEATNAIGIVSKSGRYGGGTYAQKDIAFEFGSWLSPAFKLYLIKEYQRLKEIETNQYNLEWDVRRMLSKTNYQVQTDAVKEKIVPKIHWNKGLFYADEADLLNVALFGQTAKQWRDTNPERAKSGENIRDSASINELIIVSNLESYNAILIRDEIEKKDRFVKLQAMAVSQLQTLDGVDSVRSIKKLNNKTYLEAGDNER